MSEDLTKIVERLGAHIKTYGEHASGTTIPPTATVPKGVRYVESDLLGIMVAGRVCSGGWRGIAVTCVICGRRDRLAAEDQQVLIDMSDGEAQEIFEARGWTVSPTRCPEHVGVR